MSHTLGDRLRAGDILVSDGAMGTLLQQEGLTAGQAPEIWNVERPDAVAAVAAAYAAAGSDLVHTNSFGGSPLRLAAHGLGDRTEELNRAAAECARRGAGDAVIVSGSIGPCGQLLQPFGAAAPDEVRAGFALQAAALLAGGADVLTVETMSDLNEALLAIEGIRSADPDVPVLATLTLEEHADRFHTLMGNSLEDLAAALGGAGVTALGANCGQGSDGMARLATALGRLTGLPLMIQANAGLPQLRGIEVVYPETPQDMAGYVPGLVAAGVRIIGGCCGSTPEHIAAVRRAVDAA